MDIFYTYVYYDTRSVPLVPIYVGKGKDDRYKSHLIQCHNPILRGKIKKMRALNLEPKIEFICKDVDEEFALLVECEAITKYGRIDMGTGTLCNLTDGGEGTSNLSDESKAKMSASLKIAKNTPEAKVKNSAAQKIAHARPEVKAKKSASMKITLNRPEVKAKKSASMKIAKNTPEAKAKMSAAQKIAQNKSETKAKRSISMKIAHARPEMKAKMSAAQNKPEVKEKIFAKIECPHCCKIGAKGIMKRWHFDNCKNKIQ